MFFPNVVPAKRREGAASENVAVLTCQVSVEAAVRDETIREVAQARQRAREYYDSDARSTGGIFKHLLTSSASIQTMKCAPE